MRTKCMHVNGIGMVEMPRRYNSTHVTPEDVQNDPALRVMETAEEEGGYAIVIDGEWFSLVDSSGYTLDDYNTLDEAKEALQAELGDPPECICSHCNGSGEGMYDGSRCSMCGGSGESTRPWGAAARRLQGFSEEW